MSIDTDQQTQASLQNQLPIAEMLELQNDDYMELAIQYCQHTGQPVQSMPFDQLQTILKIHGKKATKTILQYQQRSVAPEWTWLNAEGLTNLCRHQPKEYFIYAIGCLMPEHRKTDHYKELMQKAAAWRNLQHFDIDIIKPIAELARRLISRCQPSALATIMRKCQIVTIDEITATLETMTVFQLELQAALDKIIASKRKIENAGKDGYPAFKAQRQIMAMNEFELSLLHEFDDFNLIPDKRAPDTIEMLTNSSRQHEQVAKQKTVKAAKQAKPKFTGKVFNAPKTGGFKLSFGKPAATGDAK